MQWVKKLNEIEARYARFSEEMALPEVIADQSRFQKVAKASAELSEVVDRYGEWKLVQTELKSARTMLKESDSGLVELAEQEITGLEKRATQLESEIKTAMLPKDPNDEKGVVLEVRAGTGGNEATLFAADVFRMYARYAESYHWQVEVISSSDSEVGGHKEIIALITGKRVYSRLKFESGVHRVQRVPETETQGRIHTSAVTVAVLPQVDEVAVEIEPKDLRVDTYCSSGPGGQSVNTTYSAVRITHLPTNLVVTCQDEKSQIKNKAKAMQVLRSRLYELELERQHTEQTEERRTMVRSGDRSEKIRTYNFPENRVTDHRAGLKLHQLEQIMSGKLDPLTDGLAAYFEAERLNRELVSV